MSTLAFVVVVLISSVTVAIVTAIIIVVVVIAIAITIATIIVVAITRTIIVSFWIVPTLLPKMGSLMSNTWVIRPGSALTIVVLIAIVIIVSIVAGLLRFFLVINIEKLGHSINGFGGKFLSNFLEPLSP